MVSDIERHVVSLLRSYHRQTHLVVEWVCEGSYQLCSYSLQVSLLVVEFQCVGSFVAELKEK